MKIATFDFFVIGDTSRSFPVPPLHGHGKTSVSPHSVTAPLPLLAVVNLGHFDAFVRTAATAAAAEVSAENGVRCPAGETVLIDRQGHGWFAAITTSPQPIALAVALGA
jgi:hypothetical protein